MGLFRLGTLALFMAFAATPSALAMCTSAACTDETAVTNLRDLIAGACDCAGAERHGAYVKCAKQMVKAAVRDGSLPKTCKGAVVKCEAKSTCGRKNSAICCSMKKGGEVKAKIMGAGGQCSGETCDDAMSLVDACSAEAKCNKPRRGVRAFKSVQKIFTQSCALPSCHSVFQRAGGLVLDAEDVSWTSLVGQPSEHPEAAAQGLLRVKSGDPDASYLIKKLRGEGPGDPMPQVGPLLAEPLVEMIAAWIRRGAHTTAEECSNIDPAHNGGADQTLCSDDPGPDPDFEWKPEPPLEVPNPLEGLQLYTPPRDVLPGEEWETCFAFRPDWASIRASLGYQGNDLLTLREQVYRMHQGSHHLLLYAYSGTDPGGWAEGYFPCLAANCINADDCPVDAESAILLPIGGTQVAGTRYEVKYPQGVGVPIFGDQTVLIANLHYTNPFQPTQKIYGETWLNLYFHKPGERKAILDGIFAINYEDLFVEPYETRTISRIWKPRRILGGAPQDAAIFQLFGHMHARGTEFRIDYVRDGTCSVSGRLCGKDSDCACKVWQNDCTDGQTCILGPNHEDSTVYYTTDWDHAPVVDYPEPYFRVKKEEGLRWTCTHTNGVEGDATRPPRTCERNCNACGWDDATDTCIFVRGVQLGHDDVPRVYQEGDPMPLVFGLLAKDDMCNQFGYFIHEEDLDLLD